MDIAIVGQQPLLMRVVEIRAVINGGLFGGRPAEDLGSPGVKVRVEVDDADRAVGGGDGAEEGQRDGVVTTEGDDAREGFTVLGRTEFVGIGGGAAHEEGVVALFDLLDGVGVVVAALARQRC